MEVRKALNLVVMGLSPLVGRVVTDVLRGTVSVNEDIETA